MYVPQNQPKFIWAYMKILRAVQHKIAYELCQTNIIDFLGYADRSAV